MAISNEKKMISVIIPAFNSKKTLRLCLKSVYGQTYRNFEVIVVDDCSTDDSIEIAKEFKCRIIKHKENKGPAAARNTGARNARGDILFFLDSDIALNKNALKLIMEDFGRMDVSCVCGVYGEKPLIRDSIFKEYRVLQEHYWKISCAGYIDSITSSICAIKRDIFLESGGFNEKYKEADIEDAELGHRISRKYKLFMDTRIVGYHNSDDSLSKIMRVLNKRASYLVELFLKKKRFERHYATANRAAGIVFSVLALALLIISAFLPLWARQIALLSAFAAFALFMISDIGFYGFMFRKTKFLKGMFFLFVHYLMSLVIFLGICKGFVKYLAKG